MRLFVALDIDAAIREKIARFMEGVREFAPQARWVKPESLHVTLKFIGDSERMEAIRGSLSGIAAPTFEVKFRGTGFFPTPRSARVFWVGIETGPQLGALAGQVDAALAELGVEREKRAFSPHLTLARSGSAAPRRLPQDRGNTTFAKVQEKLAAMRESDFGTMTAREFFLYQSKLKPSGAEYSKLANFALKT
jgi:2'-5' RNA ligase